MESIVRILTVINVVVYIVAFAIAYNRGQSFRVYLILLAIQVILFVMQTKKVGFSGGGDAAGNGMAAGFLFLIYQAIQALMLLILLIVFFRKVF